MIVYFLFITSMQMSLDKSIIRFYVFDIYISLHHLSSKPEAKRTLMQNINPPLSTSISGINFRNAHPYSMD